MMERPMKNFDENELIDKAMAGRLNAEEQRLWAALLAERPELEAELEIGRAMQAMPKPPAVSSNFTALVLQEINKAAPQHSRWRINWLSWPRLIRTAGVAVVALAVGVQLAHMRKVEKQEAALKSFTHGLNVVAAEQQVQPEAVVSLLKDFDAIRQMPVVADVDTELLTAFTQ
jgi:anti-sigma factor RsiW